MIFLWRFRESLWFDGSEKAQIEANGLTRKERLKRRWERGGLRFSICMEHFTQHASWRGRRICLDYLDTKRGPGSFPTDCFWIPWPIEWSSWGDAPAIPKGLHPWCWMKTHQHRRAWPVGRFGKSTVAYAPYMRCVGGELGSAISCVFLRLCGTLYR